MIDFEYELNKILKDDPLDILKIKQKNIKSLDQRLKDSFDEINLFIDNNHREPSESKDINERKLYTRLKELKKDFEKITALRDFDKYNLSVNSFSCNVFNFSNQSSSSTSTL